MIASGAAVAMGIAIAIFPVFRTLMSNSAIAAWAQAVGVFVAIWMTGRAQRGQEARARMQRIETIRIIAADCERSLRLFRLECDKSAAIARYLAQTRHGEIALSISLLSELDVYDFPNSLAMRMFIRLRHSMNKLSGYLEVATGTNWDTGPGLLLLGKIAQEAKNAETFSRLLYTNLAFRGAPVTDRDSVQESPI